MKLFVVFDDYIKSMDESKQEVAKQKHGWN